MATRVLLLLLACNFWFLQSFGQEVYQVDPAQTHGLTPEYYHHGINSFDSDFIKDKIIIHNKFLRDYIIFLSYDKKNWYKVTLRRSNYAFFKLNNIYVRVLSADDRKFEAQLNKGMVYSFHYDTPSKKWVIIKFQ